MEVFSHSQVAFTYFHQLFFKAVKVRFRLLRHLRLLLFIAGEPQMLDKQNYVSLELSFHTLFKKVAFRHLKGTSKTLSRQKVAIQ